MLPAEPTHTKASFITPDCKLLNDKIPDDNYHSQQKPLRLKMSPTDFIKVMGRLKKKEVGSCHWLGIQSWGSEICILHKFLGSNEQQSLRATVCNISWY